jgi:hypothetical protein
MKTIKTLEEAFNEVRKDGSYLQYVPEALKTPKLCKIAVEQNIRALEYVPETLRTPELCKLTVEKNGRALYFVPEALRTLELCKIAVENDGVALYHVPEVLKTPELYKIAVENEGRTLHSVPNQKSFLTTYPEFLSLYFRITYKGKQDPDLISLLIQTTNNDIIDEIGDRINLDLIQEKDLPFLIGCQNKAITNFLNKKFKTKGT